jgi:hypothetical protein
VHSVLSKHKQAQNVNQSLQDPVFMSRDQRGLLKKESSVMSKRQSVLEIIRTEQYNSTSRICDSVGVDKYGTTSYVNQKIIGEQDQ